MSFDLAGAARSARSAIPVPPVPFDAIRARARARRTNERLRIAALAAVVVLCSAGLGTGVAAKISASFRVWLGGGKEAITLPSAFGVRQPMRAELRAIVAHASFPVVLPVGIPPRDRVTAVYGAPIGKPSMILISYLDPQTNKKWSVQLVDPKVVDRNGSVPLLVTAAPAPVYTWRTGGEEVMIPRSQLPADAVERMKAAMAASTPAQSLAATGPMLPTIAVLYAGDRAARAERYAPAHGPAYLLDANQLLTVPQLAKAGQPFMDRRAVFLPHVVYTNGEADFAKSRASRTTTVAVAPDGVRALGAVLATMGGPAACACDMLMYRANARNYWFWAIPLSPTGDVREYAVDARTLAVTQVEARRAGR